MPEKTISSRTSTEHVIRLRDGTELFYRAWPPSSPSDRAIVLFHRGHEHSARWQDVVDRLRLDDYWCFAWDARGHGRSPGDRGYADSFGQMVKDADEFVRAVSERHGVPIENMAVIAQSVGAVLAALWVHDYAPPVRALVIATPALRIKLYVPFAIPGLRLLRRVKGKAFIRSYVKPRLLTHDPERIRDYAEDNLISPQIAVNILLDLFDASTRLMRDAGAIHVPALLLISGSDWVVKVPPQQRLFEALSSPVKELEIYPGFFHSTFAEKERERPIARSREFIARAFEEEAAPPSLVDADQSGYSKEVFDRLRAPLPALSPRRLGFAAQAFLLKTAGKLSEGIRVGWRAGFDSGESLDHVYRNTAEGTTVLGRLIDRFYLDSPGWRGIRMRKVHLERFLDRAIGELASGGEPVRLLDIAAGPGRYVLETIRNHPDWKISAVLCDRDRSGLTAGRRLAESMNIDCVEYRESDAFDAEAIAAITPPPDIAVVSGLFEPFPSNAPVRKSLEGLSRAVRTGGFLIYTNQPWHPQQEMIARVLPNRDGDPWVMRCRTQAEMDQLVAAHGFRKIDMLIDDAGIFSVSLAVRERA